MNPLAELLSVDDIRVDLDVPDRQSLLKQLSGMLSRRQGLSSGEVWANLLKREELGSTGLGHGVAIPHARMEQCGGASAALIRTRTPIPFGAPDARPVSIFVGLIVPKQANERHLQLLAAAAAMFGDRDFRRLILVCSDAASMKDLIAAWPGKAHTAQTEFPKA